MIFAVWFLWAMWNKRIQKWKGSVLSIAERPFRHVSSSDIERCVCVDWAINRKIKSVSEFDFIGVIEILKDIAVDVLRKVRKESKEDRQVVSDISEV